MANVGCEDEALREFREAVAWYQRRKPSLARQFTTETRRVFRQIARQPESFGFYDEGIRQAVVTRFPDLLLFRVENLETVTVLAVTHTSRDPDRWRDRL